MRRAIGARLASIVDRRIYIIAAARAAVLCNAQRAKPLTLVDRRTQHTCSFPLFRWCQGLKAQITGNKRAHKRAQAATVRTIGDAAAERNRVVPRNCDCMRDAERHFGARECERWNAV